jgi:hypothetical protein
MPRKETLNNFSQDSTEQNSCLAEVPLNPKEIADFKDIQNARKKKYNPPKNTISR